MATNYARRALVAASYTVWIAFLLWEIWFAVSVGFNILVADTRADEIDVPYRRPALASGVPLTEAEIDYIQPYWLNDRAMQVFSEVEFFWINHEDWMEEGKVGSSACAALSRRYIYFINRMDHEVDYGKNLHGARSCAAHELGHIIDAYMGYPSTTEAWEYAVLRASEQDPETFEASEAYLFPGILGREYVIYEDGSIWGGYGEVFADMFEHRQLEEIPLGMRQYYRDWYE